MLMLVRDLIEALGRCSPDAEVWLAIGRRWPFQYAAAPEVVAVDEAVLIAEGQAMAYLRDETVERLGW